MLLSKAANVYRKQPESVYYVLALRPMLYKNYYIIAKILVNINNILSQKGKNVNSHKKRNGNTVP